MLLVVLLTQLLLTACEADDMSGAEAKNECHGRGYCVQWLDLSSNPHASYSNETGEWSCTYGQTAVGEIDCSDQTWHESCERVYVSPVTLDRTDSCGADPDDCNRDKPWKCDCVSEAEAEEGMSLAWMWHFAILPLTALSLLLCLYAYMRQSKSEPAPTNLKLSAIPQAKVATANSPTVTPTGSAAPPPKLATTDVQVVNAPEPKIDLAQRIQGGTDSASTFIDPDCTSREEEVSSVNRTSRSEMEAYIPAIFICCNGIFWLVLWTILSRDHDYWTGCEGTQHSHVTRLVP
eukprot:COSAG02_NODE_147_length_33939_cov_6.689539_17_plen_291_part_00